MPEFMRAAVMDAHGAPLRIGTAPRPTAGPGQVLLRIAAAGLNPLDLKVMEGAAAHARHPAPNIVGMTNETYPNADGTLQLYIGATLQTIPGENYDVAPYHGTYDLYINY